MLWTKQEAALIIIPWTVRGSPYFKGLAFYSLIEVAEDHIITTSGGTLLSCLGSPFL